MKQMRRVTACYSWAELSDEVTWIELDELGSFVKGNRDDVVTCSLDVGAAKGLIVSVVLDASPESSSSLLEPLSKTR